MCGRMVEICSAIGFGGSVLKRPDVTTALYRLGLGNFSNVKGVGRGVFECRVDFGPGYRIYFGKDGEQIVILLCGGSKLRQKNDIELAQKLWLDYKRRKRSTPWR